ncbi:MAG: 50S ribosomal protein L18 [Patescibacteria group bacterium]|jgi:large subunit ribosomal protein L18
MDKNIIKVKKQERRKIRVRAKMHGTALKPRLSVFRSLKNIYCQLIDDENQKTLAEANDKKLTGQKKIEKATEVGKMIAKKALDKKIEKVIFDRGAYRYHGRIKALAEGARAGGLKF